MVSHIEPPYSTAAITTSGTAVYQVYTTNRLPTLQDGATDRSTYRQTDRSTPTDLQTDRQTGRPTDRPTPPDLPIDRPTDRPTDTQTDRPTDRPIDRPNILDACYINPLRTAVPFWVQSADNLSDSCPTWDFSPKRIEAEVHSFVAEARLRISCTPQKKRI